MLEEILPCALDDEFSSKVKYDFCSQILLCLRGANWTRQHVLDQIYALPGYRCHKVVKFSHQWSHIHIKFQEKKQASAAADHFRTFNSDLTAVVIDDLLRDWYKFEMKTGCSPHWTLTVVDIMGATPFRLNFLTEPILKYLFQDFGETYLLPYTAALNEIHVQVLFSSMTEALSACMAFGQWYRMNEKTDQFFYRVRINPSQKEAALIKRSGGTPEEAFMLDYFVRNEISGRYDASRKNKLEKYQHTTSNESRSSDYRKQEMLHNPRTNLRTNGFGSKPKETKPYESTTYWNKGIVQKGRKQKFHRKATEYQYNEINQITYSTPVLCVPIIAPFNTYAQALLAVKNARDSSEAVAKSICDEPAEPEISTGKDKPKTYSSVLMSENLPKSIEPNGQTCELSIASTENVASSNSNKIASTENVASSNSNKIASTEKVASSNSRSVLNSDRITSNRPVELHSLKVKQKKNALKRNSRVFEKSK